MGRRPGRTPTGEERELWRRVTRDVARAKPARAPEPSAEAEANPARAPTLEKRPPPKPRITLKPAGRAEPPISTPAPARAKPSGLDRRTEERLRKGRRDPDARLDLHGMSAARAHAALKIFIADAQMRGCRMVLVITGKGSDAEPAFGETAPGVLRREAPRWLATPPLSQMIVHTSAAHPRHGGGGALYVYLKKRR